MVFKSLIVHNLVTFELWLNRQFITKAIHWNDIQPIQKPVQKPPEILPRQETPEWNRTFKIHLVIKRKKERIWSKMVNFEACSCLPQLSKKMQSLPRGKTSNIESWQEHFIKQKIKIIFEVPPPNPMLYKIHQPEKNITRKDKTCHPLNFIEIKEELRGLYFSYLTIALCMKLWVVTN